MRNLARAVVGAALLLGTGTAELALAAGPDEVQTDIQTQTTELSLQKGADTDTAVEEALARKAKTDKALKEMDDFFAGAKVTKN